jgi:hypothetical protein
MTLKTGMMNLHWEVDGDVVEFGVETLSAPETWAAFGVSDPSLAQVSMIDADVTITGVHPSFSGDGFFANEYGISSRSQCNFDSNDGVCPAVTPQSSTTLVGATVENGVRLVRFSRSVSNGKYPLQMNTSASYAWAYGPLSDDINRPVVLYHNANRAPTDFKLRLADDIQSCSPITASALNTPGTAGSKRFVRDTKEFEVTTGANPNYPNPPGIDFVLIYFSRMGIVLLHQWS